MRLVSAVYGDWYPFEKAFKCKDLHQTSDESDLTEGDVLIVWGGGDISPTLYGKPVSDKTHASLRPSHRDVIEWVLMNEAKTKDIPIIGVCRGAQMLCALAGGHLIQHVDNHAGSGHMVVTPDGYEFKVNSIHHQMMYPFDVEHEMLAWVNDPLSKVHVDVDEEGKDYHAALKIEPEFVYFPKVNGFAIQWHPEMMSEESHATQYVVEQIKQRM